MASVTLQVTINLDPVPGAMHTPAGAASAVFAVLDDRLGHYHPTVSIQSPDEDLVKSNSDQVIHLIKTEKPWMMRCGRKSVVNDIPTGTHNEKIVTCPECL